MSSAGVVEAYESVLSQFGEVVDFDISALDRLGVPVTSCSLAVDGSFRHHGNGYGLTAEAARISGLGELAEGVLSAVGVQRLQQRVRRGSRRDLLAQEGADRVVDPRTLCLPAGSPYTADMVLDWVPMERLGDGGSVWVPLEFVASESSELGDAPPLIQPITNGLGAGLDAVRPLTHGLLETLQRHTNGLRFRALDRRSPVIEGELPASVEALVERMRGCGVEPVLKHAATELGVCSTYVMGRDQELSDPIRLTACGEAAHPSAEVSLTKALLEYANSRARKAFCFGSRTEEIHTIAPAAYWSGLAGGTGAGEPRAVEAMNGWRDLSAETLRELTVPDLSTTIPYDDILVQPAPQVASQDALLAYLRARLGEREVLTVATRVGDVLAAKTIVPGLEVETLSYGRLGEAGVEKMLQADLGLVSLQGGPSDAYPDRVCLTEAAEERLGGPAWYSYAAADQLVGRLYPLYREPPRHSVAVGG